MLRLLVRRTRSVREQAELFETMVEVTHADGGTAGAAATGDSLPEQQVPATGDPLPEQQGEEPTPTPTPSPPPPPRARMPILCRTLAILAAAYGLYVLAACFGTALAGAIAASAAHPPVAATVVGLWLASELCFYLFLWRPRYRQLDALRLGTPGGPAPPSRDAAMAQFERLLALRGRLRTAAVARGTPPSSPRSADAKRQSILEHERAEVEMYLSGWFRGCDANKVRRGNVADLISMGFWYQSSSSSSSSSNGASASAPANDNNTNNTNNPPPTPAQLEAMVSRLEQAWGLSFPPGRDPSLRLMDHLNEPLRACFYPWLLYAGVGLIAALSRLVLLAAGFRRHTFRHALDGTSRKNGSQTTISLTYYMLLRKQEGKDAVNADAADAAAALPPPPIVFLHGVGGLFAYTVLLARLAADGGSGVLAPGGAFLALELPHVSLTFSSAPVPTTCRLAAAVAALVAHVEQQRQQQQQQEQQQRAGYQQEQQQSGSDPVGAAHGGSSSSGSSSKGSGGALIVAHSYGSLIAARLVRAHRSSVAGLVLVDAVCFAMYLPQLLRGYFYCPFPRSPLADPPTAARALVLRLLSRELTQAATMARAFFWSEMNLWPEDLPDGTVVMLGGRDELVDSAQVRNMLLEAPSLSPSPSSAVGAEGGDKARASAPPPPRVRVLYDHGAAHGAVLLSREARGVLLSALRAAGRSLHQRRTGGSALDERE